MTITRFPAEKVTRIPRPIAYPSDYGLALAVNHLISDYGIDGAVNRLVEMAERIAKKESPYDWVLRRRRVERPEP